MTQDEIIAMAREAGFKMENSAAMQAAKAFYKLVAAKAIKELESQEPVGWMYQEYRDDDQFGWRDEILFIQPPNDPIYFRNIVPVYAHPAQRTWVGLTNDELTDLFYNTNLGQASAVAQAIELLKEKNT